MNYELYTFHRAIINNRDSGGLIQLLILVPTSGSKAITVLMMEKDKQYKLY